MRAVTVRHYWRNFNDEDVYEGDISVEPELQVVTFEDVRDLIRWVNDEVFSVGDWNSRPETSDGGETLYYSCQWPEGFRTGDPQYRDGSLHFSGAPPQVLRAVIERCGVYDANARRLPPPLQSVGIGAKK